MFYQGNGPSGTPVPTGFGENFDILIVGEYTILPSFIKISLCFARAFKERPYGFNGCLKLLSVGEGLAPPILPVAMSQGSLLLRGKGDRLRWMSSP